MQTTDWKKYFIVFLITVVIFGSALYISNSLNQRKINQLQTIQDNIAVDILSAEVQFSLLEELSCKDVTTNSVLSAELGTFADKIEYGERNLGSSEEITHLKKYYSLLEIKDYLLMKKISERCGQKSNVFVLYFYANEADCADCVRQGYILTDLRATYPELRVYSFDYNLDLSAVKAMKQIYKIPTALPALVINGKVYAGLQTKEEIESVLKLTAQKATVQKAKVIEE